MRAASTKCVKMIINAIEIVFMLSCFIYEIVCSNVVCGEIVIFVLGQRSSNCIYYSTNCHVLTKYPIPIPANCNFSNWNEMLQMLKPRIYAFCEHLVKN